MNNHEVHSSSGTTIVGSLVIATHQRKAMLDQVGSAATGIRSTIGSLPSMPSVQKTYRQNSRTRGNSCARPLRSPARRRLIVMR